MRNIFTFALPRDIRSELVKGTLVLHLCMVFIHFLGHGQLIILGDHHVEAAHLLMSDPGYVPHLAVRIDKLGQPSFSDQKAERFSLAPAVIASAHFLHAVVSETALSLFAKDLCVSA
ncbi:MAG: hypothetical protein GDA36_12315 [Rhodobacteraceae bacterium]|nr:hypothetical protein [Paracoccaceae bacterium]